MDREIYVGIERYRKIQVYIYRERERENIIARLSTYIYLYLEFVHTSLYHRDIADIERYKDICIGISCYRGT